MMDYILKPVRTSAILTNSYVAGTVVGIDATQPTLLNQVVLYVDFTKGSLTSGEVKVEFSNDNSDYYQETTGLIGGGVNTLSTLVYSMTATGKYRIPIPIKDAYIKVSANGTGTVTNSLMAIGMVIGKA